MNQIPATWNELSEFYFSIQPSNDSEGCLQDIHWDMGGLGYFATYTLGNLNASQLFAKANTQTQVANAFQQANYKPLLDFMREHIQSKESILLPQDLLKQSTSETTNPTHHLNHLNHLKRRYLF